MRSRHALAATGVACALAALTAACATVVEAGPAASPTPPTDADPLLAAALAAWADFPAAADPRPLVVLRRVLGSGFQTGDAKVAFGTGNWADPPALPEGPAEFGGYPVIPAREALDRLRAETGDAEPQGTRLQVSDVRLGTTDVPTDRGTVALPAWRVLFPESAGPNWVLAVRPPRLDGHPIPAFWWDWSGSLDGDGRGLTVTAPSIYDSGFGGGPCVADFVLAVAEADNAVAVRVLPAPGVEPRDSVDCDAPLTFPVPLSAPLGGRVLLGVSGEGPDRRGPVAVTSGGEAAG